MNDIISLCIAVLGSGGLCSVVTALMSKRKYRAEATLLETEAEEKRKTIEREYMSYIHDQFKDITETHKREAEESRAQNRILTARVNELESRINKLMEWIVVDNNSRVTWLESELRKYNPSVIIPPCRPAPGFESWDDPCSSATPQESDVSDQTQPTSPL